MFSPHLDLHAHFQDFSLVTLVYAFYLCIYVCLYESALHIVE